MCCCATARVNRSQSPTRTPTLYSRGVIADGVETRVSNVWVYRAYTAACGRRRARRRGARAAVDSRRAAAARVVGQLIAACRGVGDAPRGGAGGPARDVHTHPVTAFSTMHTQYSIFSNFM